MYVLITNGSNAATWYHNKAGALLPVSYVIDAHYFVTDDVAPDEGEFGPCAVHAADGKLLYEDAEYTAIRQELLQRREEVAELTRERDMLLQQIERTLDEQKPVVLPREVCDSLDEAKAHNDNIDYLAWLIAQEDSSGDGYEWLKLLRTRANDGSFLELVDALRYGYTVEEPEVSLEGELADIVHHWRKDMQKNYLDDAKSDRLLAARILDRIKQKEQKSG
ncbi:MAG: hypothetical protein J7559_02880 [Cohnella sp.]|nr:hypothetical protein [Cohnella sp.]